jgi:acyl-CoA oxidase
MAYDAAVDAKLDRRITDLYEAAAVKLDSAWYVAGANYTVSKQIADEDRCLEAALPCLDDWLADTGVEKYVQVPILTPGHWQAFVDGLPAGFESNPTGFETTENSYWSRL